MNIARLIEKWIIYLEDMTIYVCLSVYSGDSKLLVNFLLHFMGEG